MLLCGIDVGTSSIKVSIVDASNQQLIYSCSFPEYENEISSPEIGFAEQDPEHWWFCVKQGILKANASKSYNPNEVKAIGISYQMHGLVVLDRDNQVLRPSIIWCDSRSVEIGNKAFHDIGTDFCNTHLLNSPGNFTASKLAWVKQNQPDIYSKIAHVLLPGDFIAGRFTNEFTTTSSALSEGILWDFKTESLSSELLNYFGFEKSLFPVIKPLFGSHGQITSELSDELGFHSSTIVGYKAGDQPNNAFSLGVLSPGDIATTAGTSGVVYGISDERKCDVANRVNSFAHVNHGIDLPRIGVLMCINGTGILNRWVRQNFYPTLSYKEMNNIAAKANIGSADLHCIPFGNGSERIFQNKTIGGSFQHLDFNRHGQAEIIRATHEGIAFSMVYGIELMNSVGIVPKKLKAGLANMYLSDIFCNTIVNASNATVELVESDGAFGAALGAGYGLGFFKSAEEAVAKLNLLKTVEPSDKLLTQTQDAYSSWKTTLGL